ncbi:MAG: hypothetical protein Q4C96_10405 [Planctomycetia bacterium]|nr:hypothetical protein [Planctomycetia bacterium]
MAKRTINRKEQRLPVDDYEMEIEEVLGIHEDEDEEEEKPVKKTRKKVKRATKTSAAAKEVRLKAFWGVYSQSLQCVKLFEYGDREEAEKLAADLTESKKAPHFVRLDKQVIE